MKGLRQILRLITIQRVLVKHGLDELVFAIHLLRPLRWAAVLNPLRLFRAKPDPNHGVRIRRSLEDLGPIFIKFGQMLSTRRDLLPDDIAEELTKLQDNVPPFDNDLARSTIEKALGDSIEALFSEFSAEPLASASIAQVHAAKLKNGDEVVIKVVRPRIHKVIRRDINLLYTIAELAEKYSSEARRLHPIEVVQEFDKTLMDELDLTREAANAAEIRRNFDGNKALYIPNIYWDYTRRNVMVMERINGIPVANVDELRKHNVNLKVLSERGVEIFFTQVFRHNFFHADMHPGNIFVSPDNPNDPQYMAIDFGIVGSLAEEDQRYLAENFYAFFKRDYKRVAELHVESGWVPKNTRVDEFESAIRTVCEPIFDRPLKEISFGHVLLRLFQTARRFHMEVQPQLVLLQKTLLNIEGLGRQLYPDLDLWQTAKPFLERWMDEQVGVRGFAKGVKKNLPELMEHLPSLPIRVNRLLNQALEGELSIQWESKQLNELKTQLRFQHQRQIATISGAALVIAAAIIYTTDTTNDVAAVAIGGIGIIINLYSWFKSKA